MNILPLSRKQLKDVAAVVARAFFNYPSLVYYFPDPKRRMRNLPWYMERVLNSALVYGQALITEDRSGVLFLLPPGHTRLTDWDYVKCGFLAAPLVIGLNRYPASNDCETHLAQTQEKLLGIRPHYYLWGLAVDPAKQRGGAGTALLGALFAQANRERMPIYLETHMQENVPYYEARGFRLIHTDVVPKHNLEFWCLLREPDTAGTQSAD